MDVESLFENKNTIPDENKLKGLVKELVQNVGESSKNVSVKDIERTLIKLRHRYKTVASKYQLRYIYEKYYPDISLNKTFSRFLIKKACRSRSGVLVCTIVLKPSVFSCPKKCSYCPTETDLQGNPTQPKSYLSSEPAMLRALQYNFDVKGQIWDRLNAYIKTGNITKGDLEDQSHSNKLEIIISGGTWESYPYEYRKSVMNEVYWAANTFRNDGKEQRSIQTIEEEIKENETAKYRVIGMTLETRPDFITKTSIKDYRRWGVTRVQIGVQHYDDEILKGINRDCDTLDTIRAIKLLKQTGFKVVCHLMPDLPGSSPSKDRWMFRQAINNPLLQFDDVKIYPTAICKSNNPNLLVKSDISDWYAQGLYKPYGETDLRVLIEVLKEYKVNIQPWVRIQRLVRDIPQQSIEAGYERKSHLRQVIHDELKEEGKSCRCIRCKEIGDEDELRGTSSLVVRPYEASEGMEYHISVESNTKDYFCLDFWKMVWFYFTYYFMMIFLNKKIYWGGNLRTYNGLIGFCRLRLDDNAGAGFIPELKDCALIREVHVYGHSLGVNSNDKDSSQHKGYGKLLVKTAEEIAVQNGYKKIAVIAGVGTREYYKNKCGYHLEGTYMVKELKDEY